MPSFKEGKEILMEYEAAASKLDSVKTGMETLIKNSGISVNKFSEALGFKSRVSLTQRFTDPSKWTFDEIKRVYQIIEGFEKVVRPYPVGDDYERIF